ncbi:hypothetical protein BN903_471 [Halorubrum sp. AJ67]|nr:hypothetical protein BN903_471 [Halorubrum sp. AJ67]
MNTGNSELGQNERYEECDSCNDLTIHEITVEFTSTGSGDPKTHGKAPFRVTRCLTCETTTKLRVGSMKQAGTR